MTFPTEAVTCVTIQLAPVSHSIQLWERQGTTIKSNLMPGHALDVLYLVFIKPFFSQGHAAGWPSTL